MTRGRLARIGRVLLLPSAACGAAPVRLRSPADVIALLEAEATCVRADPTADPVARARAVSALARVALTAIKADHARLVAAAPRVTVAVPETFPRAMVFREVLDLHRADRLELAARSFQTKRPAEDYDEGPGGRMANVARTCGYLLLAARDGWDAFSEPHLLPRCGLELALVGGDTLRMAEEVAANLAARPGPAGTVRTAALVAEELVEVFAARLAWWDVGRG